MDEQLRRVFSAALGLDDKETASLSEGDSIHTVNNWDSLGHLRLILALEHEYGVSILDEDAIQLVSVGRIGAFLNGKGIVGRPT